MSLMPMNSPMYGGVPIDPMTGLPKFTPPIRAQQPGIMDRIGGLLGGGQSYGGLLSPQDEKAARNQALMAMGAQLLQAGGPSPVKIGTGQALGGALMSGLQARDQANESALQAILLKSQIAKNERDTTADPASVREYEYARKNGFKGTFQDWIVAGGQSSRPSAVQEWEHYAKLMEDDKKNGTNNAQLYLEMKRNPNFVVRDINEVPTVVRPSVVAGTTATPLSDLPTVIGSAAAKERETKSAGARGQVEGALQGEITKKGSNAVSTKGMLDIAEPLIDVATGSATGAAADKVAAFFGRATTGAEAIAQLQVLQASLMTSMPRMEGPQSDRDVDLYRQAAGQIGDPNVPGPIKKAALQTIRQLQDRYIDRAQQQDGRPAQPNRSREDILKQYGL